MKSLSKHNGSWETLIRREDFDTLLSKVSAEYGYDPNLIKNPNIYEKSMHYGMLMRKMKNTANALHSLDKTNVDLNN
jgi:hypothetical protein